MKTEKQMLDILKAASDGELMTSDKSEEIWDQIESNIKQNRGHQRRNVIRSNHVFRGAIAAFAIVIVAAGSYTLLRHRVDTGSSTGKPVQQLPKTEQQAINKTLSELKAADFPVKMPTRIPYRLKNGRIKVSYMPQQPSKIFEVDIYFRNSPRGLTINEVRSSPSVMKGRAGQKVQLGNGADGYYMNNGARSMLIWRSKDGILVNLSSYKVNNKTSPPSSKPDLGKEALIQIADSFH